MLILMLNKTSLVIWQSMERSMRKQFMILWGLWWFGWIHWLCRIFIRP